METGTHAVSPIRIGLLDFEPLRVAGLREIFARRPEIEITATDLTGALGKTQCDLIVLAMRDEAFTVTLLTRLRARQAGLRVIVLGCGSDEERITEIIAAGAKGWLEETASPEQLLQAVDVVLSGSIWAPRRVLSRFVDRALGDTGTRVRGLHPRLTEREEQVLRQLVLARSNREIAQALSIREQTVKSYVARLMRKVGVGNRIALSMEAASGEWWANRPAEQRRVG
jgi:DNA-binding NarL/FixJ family response regulator